MERQIAQDDSRDTVPESIEAPDILADYNIWTETHWDYWTIRNAPDSWLTRILMAHAESSRIQAELYDDAYRVDTKSRDSRGREIDDTEVAELRQNPKFAHLPEAALKKMFRKRG